MSTCKHKWEMTDIRHGYLLAEGCSHCNARSLYFSKEIVAPIEEYVEGEHFWRTLGSSQATKFKLKCVACGKIVNLDDMTGLMMSTCNDPNCKVATIRKEGGKNTWVYVALCADSNHASAKCVSAEGIGALNEYFNQNISSSGKKIVVVPCEQCCSGDRCQGIVIADTGLTEIY